MNEKINLDCVEVDLTPVLPGADNGGAKILVLELIRQFGKLAPNTKFVLLTTDRNHQELSVLERGSVYRRRSMEHIRPARTWRNRILRHSPWAVHRLVFQLRTLFPIGRYYKVHPPNAGLLFFPFGLSPPCQDLYLNVGSVPSVAIVYDLQHLAYPDFFKAEELAERQRCLNLHKKNSSFIVISGFVRDSMIEHGVRPECVFTAYIRMHPRVRRLELHATRECLKRLGLEEQRYLVYPANFWPHKNHEMLLAAFALARSGKMPSDFKLVCTGAPSERLAKLKDRASSLSLAEFVVFPGFLGDAEFATLIQSSAGVVFPSLYEGYGMPVIEAMAVGCPVACSDAASLPEIAGDAALFFDPREPSAVSDAMCRIATDEELRSNLIARGFQQAQRFCDVEQMAREYWDVFEHVIQKRKEGLFVTGVYQDGWAAPSFSIFVPEGSSDRTLRLELDVPGWLPIRRFVLAIAGAPKPVRHHITVQGCERTIDVPVHESAGRIDVQVKPFFRPSELPKQHNRDGRRLTVRVVKIELRDSVRGTCFVWPNGIENAIPSGV